MSLAIIAFLTVSVGIVAGYHLLVDLLAPDADRVRRRLADAFDPNRAEPVQSALFKNIDDMSLESSQTHADIALPGPRQGMKARLELLLQQANLPQSVAQLCAVAAGVGLALGLLALVLLGPLVAMSAAAVGALAPLGYIHYRVTARRDKLLRQLPNAFDLMARVLRAGSSVPAALPAVAEAFEDPIAGDFAQCQKQLDLGIRPEITYQEMAQRSGIVELRIFVMAMMIQRQTGGNLSEVLERLAGLIRARLRLRQQVRSLTAEGRMQGLTLTVLPFLMYAAMLAINYDYAVILLDHVGLLLLTGASMLLGTLWIRRIVNFEV